MNVRKLVLPVAALALTASATLTASPSSATPPSPAPTACAAPAPKLGVPRTPAEKAQAEAMAKLDFMVGEWEGPATVTTPDGKKLEIVQHELVERRLSGELITVQGTGTIPGNDAAPPVFTAFAVATYDENAKQYRWRAHSQGNNTETELEVKDNWWAWETPAGPNATIRNETTFTACTWSETTKLTTDGGKTWQEMVRMELTRKQ